MNLLRFLDLADFTAAEIRDLPALADRLQRNPEPRALAGRILGLVFLNPSLRTLASFQAGMARLGGTSFVITPGQGTWALETRLGVRMDGTAAEHIREGLPVLAAGIDWRLVDELAKLGGVFRRDRIRDGRDELRDFHQRPLQAAKRRC